MIIIGYKYIYTYDIYMKYMIFEMCKGDVLVSVASCRGDFSALLPGNVVDLDVAPLLLASSPAAAVGLLILVHQHQVKLEQSPGHHLPLVNIVVLKYLLKQTWDWKFSTFITSLRHFPSSPPWSSDTAKLTTSWLTSAATGQPAQTAGAAPTREEEAQSHQEDTSFPPIAILL